MPVDATAAIAALDVLSARLTEASRETAGDGARAVQILARSFAPMGVGTLKASIIIDGPRQAATVTGLPKGMSRLGPGAFAAKVGPTVVYGRIREIGGRIPGYRTTMTHPYLRWWNRQGGGWVFWNVPRRGQVKQHGTRFLKRATDLVEPAYRDIMVRRVRAAILSI